MQCFDKFDRFFLHIHNQCVNAISIVAITDQCRYCDGQAGSRRYQGLCDSTSKNGRVADTMCRYGGKHLNHADNRSQKAEERRYRGNRPQGIQVALELMHHMATGILDTVLHDHALTLAINQTGRQYLSKRRTLVKCLYLALVERVFLYPAPHLAGQVLRNHALLLQRPEPLENYPHCDNCAKDDRRHQPAASFNDFNHVLSL